MPFEQKSLWIAITSETEYPQLQKDIETDVVIVGGGIAGINAAYFLTLKGFRTVIIEAFRIATGTSGNTTAKITCQHGLKYSYLLDKFGKEKAKIYADSNQWAIDAAEKIISEEKIKCNFYRFPSYVYSVTKTGLERLMQEIKVTKDIGLPSSITTTVESVPFNITGAIRFENQAYFHPRKYLLSLAEKIILKGGKIFENTRALDIKEGKDCEVPTDKGSVKAKYVVIATNFPFYKTEMFANQIRQIRSYAMAVAINNKIPVGMFINYDEKTLSFRAYSGEEGDWLITGGEDHVAGEGGTAGEHFEKLRKDTSARFNIKNIDYQWAAQDSNPADDVPCIGFIENSKRVLVTRI